MVGPRLAGAAPADAEPQSPPAQRPAAVRALPETIDVPLVGEVRLRTLSLSVLTVLLAALDGIVLLAFAVNLVEAVCSAGIPAAYYAYLALYIAVFMLDDLIVFIAAMKPL